MKNENAISLGSVEGEKDLKPIPGVANINPPPQNGKCMYCKRHISELKPYGKAGDPLVGDFDGALLVKVWRPEGPYDEEAESAFNEALNHCQKEGIADILEWMKKRHGEKKGLQLYGASFMYNSVRSVWLCRDCVVLGPDEYFKRM